MDTNLLAKIMKKRPIPTILASLAVIAVSAYVIKSSVSGLYHMETYETTVPAIYVGVIVGESIINDVIHSSGLLQPGETRVARGTEVVHVPVGL